MAKSNRSEDKLAKTISLLELMALIVIIALHLLGYNLG